MTIKDLDDYFVSHVGMRMKARDIKWWVESIKDIGSIKFAELMAMQNMIAQRTRPIYIYRELKTMIKLYLKREQSWEFLDSHYGEVAKRYSTDNPYLRGIDF